MGLTPNPDVLDVPSADPIALRRSLSDSVNSRLLPRLAPAAPQLQARQGPKNGEAYSLFLRASALSTDEKPNAEAWKLLEESVTLDPGYAPAWSAIAARAYYSYQYSTGGMTAVARAREAAQRALDLDPDLVDAAGRLVVIRTESGDTIEAARDASKLLARRPNSVAAHFLRSYTLRYGGDLQQAAKECDTAFAMDPHMRGLRSCAIVFMQLGRYDRAQEFTGVDAGTEWSNDTNGSILIARGQQREALVLLQRGPLRDFIAAFVEKKSPAELDAAVSSLRDSMHDAMDGEPFYGIAATMAMCGRPSDAIAFLREAIRRNYCVYPAIDSDPSLAAIRHVPEYAALRNDAMQCHAKFMEAMR